MQKLLPLSRDEIINKLCFHDPRRDTVQNLWRSKEPQPDNCHCDNCFYGKHELASQLLDVLDDLHETEKELERFQKDPSW